ncbi:restriction endonuclease subunit S [Aeromonas australiensis]|uniref:restriction endonuclease subunit S n=1 Tax=Aeromonas australiensis TaxID=1114880 RepID=UPI000589B8B1|nr:restriction endonuclease subunit S [Aeromonas australiensis]
MSNSLPQGWASCTLADIAAVNPKTVADESLIAGFVPMSHAPTSYHGELLFDEKLWGEIKKSYTNFQDGDVIFAKVTPCFENGKAAIVDDLPNGIGAGSSEFYVLRPHCSDISQKLLFALIKTHAFMQEGATNMTGAVGLRRVPKSFVETFPIALPPAAEQKEIIDRLDKLLAQVEATQARLARIPDIIKRFRQSVLTSAFYGFNGNNFINKKLSEFIDIQNGARRPVSASTRANIKGDIPYYGATGIVDYLNDYTHEGRFLLVGEDGANLLSKNKDLAFIIDGKAWVNNHVHVLKEKADVNLDFIKIVVNSLDLSPWVTGTTQPKLTKRALGELPVPFFAYEKQTEIVRRVEQLFAYADTLEQQAKAAKARVDKLTQAILAKAFRGELTADWRAANPDLISGDHSAAALLARIQAERAAAKPHKRATKTSAT